MAKVREEIVGKRYLSVSSGDNLTLNAIASWDWRCGIIRACTHRDIKHAEIQILVEYDDVPWQRREWLHLYRDQTFKVFMIEHSLVWTPLKGTIKHRGSPSAFSPGLAFDLLLDDVHLKESDELPVENIVDRSIEFLDYSTLKKFQDNDWPWPCTAESESAVRSWVADQAGQHILCTTPSVLVGFRVQVYRSEGTTQWYTAVIVGYNETTRELTVTDDTVLEAHSEDPSLVHIRLLGEGVVQSIMRGEKVGITPRRSRSSLNNTQQTMVRIGRRDTLQPTRSRTGSHSRSINYPSSPYQGLSPSSPISPLPSPTAGGKPSSPNAYYSTVVSGVASKAKAAKTSKDRSGEDSENSCKKKKDQLICDVEVVVSKGSEPSSVNSKYSQHNSSDYKFSNPISPSGVKSPHNPIHSEKDPTLDEDNFSCENSNSACIVKQNCSKDHNCNSACKLKPDIELLVQSNSTGNSDITGITVESPEVQVQLVESNSPHGQQSVQTGCDKLLGESRTSCNTDKLFWNSDTPNNSYISNDPSDDQESHSKPATLNVSKFSESEPLVNFSAGTIRTESNAGPEIPIKVKLEEKCNKLREAAYNKGNLNVNVPQNSPDGVKLFSEVIEEGPSFSIEEIPNNKYKSVKNESNFRERSFTVTPVSIKSPNQIAVSDSISCVNKVTESQDCRQHTSRTDCKVLIAPLPAISVNQSESRDATLCSSSLTELSQSLAVAGAVSGRAVTITATSGPAPQGTSRVASPPSVSITAVVRSPNSQPELAAHHQDGASATQLQLLQHQLSVSHQPSAGTIPSSRMDQCDGSSDSGVSVTERSVSRSSVLSDDRSSSAEVKSNTPTPNISQSKATNLNLTVDRKEPVKVWRNPALISQSDLSIRHIHSLQHNMSQHYPGVPSHVPSPNAAQVVAPHPVSHGPAPQTSGSIAHGLPPGLPYPPHHGPPLHLAHGLQNSFSAAAAMYPQLTPDLWKQLGHVTNPLQNSVYPRMMSRQDDFFLELEKQNRERREAEASREKQAKEKMERERAEQRHREKRERDDRVAREWRDKDDIRIKVNQHFEDSFRLAASQKKVPWNQNVTGMPLKVESRDIRQQPGSHSSPSNDLLRKVKEPQQLITDGICRAFKKDDQSFDLRMKSHPPPAHSKHLPDKNLAAGMSYPVAYGMKEPKPSHERNVYIPQHEKASVIVQPDMKYDKGPSHSLSPKQKHPGRASPFSSCSIATYNPYEAQSPHRPASSHMSISHSSSPHGLEILKARQTLSSPHSNPQISERFGSTLSKTPPISHFSSNLQSANMVANLQQSGLYPGKHTRNSPPQSYGKPGIMAGGPAISKLDIRINQQQITSLSAPPPAHTSNRSIDNRVPPVPSDQRNPVNCAPFEVRAFTPGGPTNSRPNNTSPYPTLRPATSPQLPAHHPAQTQPLDFTKEVISSIKKRTSSPPPQEVKKARLELASQPVLSRVSEPSSLYFPPATTITTVVNVLAANLQRTMSPSLHSASNANPEASSSPVTLNCNSNGGSSSSTSHEGSAANSPLCDSPNQYGNQRQDDNYSPGVVKQTDSEKVNMPSSDSYVRKLKKVWTQRHEGSSELVSSNGSGSVRVSTQSPSATKTAASRSESKIVPRKMKSAISNGHVQKPKDADDSSTDSDGSSSQKKQTKTKKSLKRSKKSSDSDSDKESEGSDEDRLKKSDRLKLDSEPRKKRGRKPKAKQKEDDPKMKKLKEEPSLSEPMQKTPVSQLKKTGESFLQHRSCYEIAPKLPKCRECRWTPYQRNKKMPDIFCRFCEFRRLRYTKNGQLAVAGFSDPIKNAFGEDLRLWTPDVAATSDLNSEKSKFLLLHVGDQFCDLLQQEKEAISLGFGEDTPIAWKRVVQLVREMCDVCQTTLFNFHWACSKCGFVVCIDCYKARKEGTIKMWDTEVGAKERDKFSWLLCASRVVHEQDKLMLTQIIAGDALTELGHKVHETRYKFGIPMYCVCSEAEIYKEREQQEKSLNGIKKEVKTDRLNGKVKSEDDVNGNDDDVSNSPLNFFADVALSNDKLDSESCMSDTDSDSDGRNSQPSTLRELLVRPNSKVSTHAKPEVNTMKSKESKKKAKIDTLDDVISCVIERGSDKDNKKDIMKVELKHFIRRYNYSRKGREPLPIRIMTKTESRLLYPNVPHSWLCDGKLLRLQDPFNEGNVAVFQDQWKRGQPVIVSGVGQKLDEDLWKPYSFSRDFGEQKNNLINCLTDNVVPNQQIKKFWDGFDSVGKRLKDDKGQPMVLKLKDWPPMDDFASFLPARYDDLMKVLPMGEYTKRNGCFNLASRLPDSFVRPDLGPKMYIAYGSATFPSRASTNLHLDISDAANVMCFVGLPDDVDHKECIEEALKAIDDAGCDILTRQRVREKEELPGALWHIYHSRDSDKIRDLLNKVAIERGKKLEPYHDPIHDQSWYLDGYLRERLYKEYGVEGYAIVQCMGDAVFIPAGAPHQVRNILNCIKVAEDFVSPENISHCFHLTQEFRHLSDTHTNHEDKLQIKNIIYHAMKESVAVLMKENQLTEKKSQKDS